MRHLHAYTFTLYVKYKEMYIEFVRQNFTMVLRHGQTFFLKKTTKHVNLEYNKYKLRTAFDETKRSSHLLHFCDIVLIPQMFAQLA